MRLDRLFLPPITAAFTITLTLTLLAGCGLWSQSKYAPFSAWGQSGYRETQMDETTYQVTFCGNSVTPPDRVDQYALFRCADLTVQRGYDYFVVIDGSKNATAQNYEFVNGHSTSIEHDIDPMSGKLVPVAVSTANISTVTQTLHSATKTIRMFKGVRPSENASAYDAKSMLKFMGPQIERGDVEDTTSTK